MIIAFVILTYLITWVGDFVLPIHYLDFTMFVPGVVALLLLFFRREKILYLFKFGLVKNILQGFFVSISAFLLYMLFAHTFSLATFAFAAPINILSGNHGSTVQIWSHFILYTLPFFLGINLFFAMFEEMGWRGYLLNQINQRQLISSFWLKGLVIGLIWGIWHVPLMNKLGTPSLAILCFILNVCLISILYAWLFLQRSSIWPATVAHATHNLLFNTMLPMVTVTQAGNDIFFTETGLLTTISYATIILLSVCYARF